jgi:hypothetical protein
VGTPGLYDRLGGHARHLVASLRDLEGENQIAVAAHAAGAGLAARRALSKIRGKRNELPMCFLAIQELKVEMMLCPWRRGLQTIEYVFVKQ